MNFLQPREIAEAISAVGKKKGETPLLKVSLLGIVAGAFIAFAAMSATWAGSGWPGEWAGSGACRALSAAAFTVGLILTVTAGAELFTGNNMFFTMAVLTHETTVIKLIINWIVVFFTNFIGALIIVAMVYYGDYLFQNGELTGYGVKALATAEAKMSLDWLAAFTRGIGCNWLVCLAVWIAAGAKDIIGKIFACFFPIFTFVICGFEHCVANMFFIPVGIFAAGGSVASLTVNSFLINNLLPVTLGNIVGGAVFVAMIYWFTYLKKVKIVPHQEDEYLNH